MTKTCLPVDAVWADDEFRGAVLDRRFCLEQLAWHLALFAHHRHANAERLGHHGRKDEAARVHARHQVNRGVGRRHQLNARLAEHHRAREDGRDVKEEDPWLGKVLESGEVRERDHAPIVPPGEAQGPRPPVGSSA